MKHQLEQLREKILRCEVTLLVTVPRSNHVELDCGAWEDLATACEIEWVDLPSYALDPTADQNVDDNEFGLGRIVQALQSTVWADMTRHPVLTALGRLQSVSLTELEADRVEDDFKSLILPQVPCAKSYVPLVPEFPPSLLPSFPRRLSPRNSEDPLTADSPTFSLSPPLDHCSFEDDFSPFVSGEDATLSNSLEARLSLDQNPKSASLEEHSSTGSYPSLSLTTAPDDVLERAAQEEFDAKENTDDLDYMFSRIKAFRSQATGLGFEERRELAERAMKELLGD